MVRRIVLMLCLGVVSGCGDQLVPVEGTATLDGKPLASVTLYFVPESGGKVSAGPVDEEGRFHLYTGNPTGVLPGKYRVSVSKLRAVRGMLTEETLPPHISSQTKSQMIVEVPKRGKRDLEINFSTKPQRK